METPTEFIVKYNDPAAQSLFAGVAERNQPLTRASEVLEHLLVRTVEIGISLTVLILTLPITLAIALIIRMGTPGSPLFFQTRVGKDRKPFRFLKFRTMYADAKERFPELYKYSYDEDEIKKVAFKVKDDPRVTPQGRWLRKTSLDELLNFWNVLTGDMALVGPRPDIPQMLPYYDGRMLRKFDVRPGVTGLAQVSGRGDLSFHDTVKLDVEYVRNRSVKFDLDIIFRTIKGVVVGRGAF